MRQGQRESNAKKKKKKKKKFKLHSPEFFMFQASTQSHDDGLCFSSPQPKHQL